MAFKESLKEIVRKKSDGRCVICCKPFVEIHHIIPQSENGPDTIDNAVALCAYCHELLRDSPSKRKKLKEMRDSRYEIIEAKKKSRIIENHYVHEKLKFLHEDKHSNGSKIAIYHVVYENETFKDAANAIIELTREAQKQHPNKIRVLYLDIDGHRLENGAFDHDMLELQYNFIMKNISHYYSEINIPLISCKNKFKQANDPLPDDFIVYEENEIPEELKHCAGTMLTQIYKTEKELSTT
ncbi:MAG: HNH endonuclease [Bacilli bacterium]|nr:HNH endonuclease [Bacilli bacterium]